MGLGRVSNESSGSSFESSFEDKNASRDVRGSGPVDGGAVVGETGPGTEAELVRGVARAIQNADVDTVLLRTPRKGHDPARATSPHTEAVSVDEEAALSALPLGCLRLGSDGRIVAANHRACDVLSLSHEIFDGDADGDAAFLFRTPDMAPILPPRPHPPDQRADTRSTMDSLDIKDTTDAARHGLASSVADAVDMEGDPANIALRDLLTAPDPFSDVCFGLKWPSARSRCWVGLSSGSHKDRRQPRTVFVTSLDAPKRTWSRHEENYRAALRGLSEGVIVQDADGTISDVNPSAALVLGTQPSDMVGQRFQDVVPQDGWAVHPDGRPLGPGDFPSETARLSGKPCSRALVGICRSAGERAWSTSMLSPSGCLTAPPWPTRSRTGWSAP